MKNNRRSKILTWLIAVMMAITLIPTLAFAGTGTEEDPYTFDDKGGELVGTNYVSLAVYPCDQEGTIQEDAEEMTSLELTAGSDEVKYFRAFYKDGSSIVAGKFVKKNTTTDNLTEINYIRLQPKNTTYTGGNLVINGNEVSSSIYCSITDKNVFSIDASKITNGGTGTLVLSLSGTNALGGVTKWVSSDIGITVNEASANNPVTEVKFAEYGLQNIPLGEETTYHVSLSTKTAGKETTDTIDDDILITAESSDQSFVANEDIRIEPADNYEKHLSYTMTISPQKIVSNDNPKTITVRYKGDGENIFASLDFTTYKTRQAWPGILVPGSVWDIEYSIYPLATTNQQLEWSTDKDGIVSIDEEGSLSALKPGDVTVIGTSVEDKDIQFEWDLTVGNPGIKIEDSVDAEYLEDTIDWDVSKQGSELQLYAFLNPEKKASIYWASSNTDVAEVSKIGEGNDGKVSLKKEGTVTIYAIYNYSNQGYPILGKVTINVKGCGETADVASWDTLDSSQSYDGTETSSIYAYIRLTSHGVESNSFNNAFFQNQITELVSAKDAEFTFLIGNRNPDTNFNEEIYLNSLLSNVYICKINDNGERGEIVATYNKGYTLKSVDYENGSSGQGTGVAVAIPTIKLDSGILNKGAKYALIVDRSAKAPDGARLYKDAEYQFKTVGGAQKVEITDAESNELEALTLKKAETSDIQAVMKLEGYKAAPDDTVNWESDNPDVADVEKVKEENGISFAEVTAKAPGKAVITAAAEDGEGSDSCTVTVPGIDLKNTKITLTEGDTYKLDADLYSDDQQLKIEWSSLNEDVATVDEDGNITAVSAGEAIITGTAGEYTAETTVTVKAAPEGYDPVSDVDQDGDDGTSDSDTDSDKTQDADDSASTGDNMNIWMLIALLAASGTAGTAALRRRAKQ